MNSQPARSEAETASADAFVKEWKVSDETVSEVSDAGCGCGCGLAEA
jgi:hypothetical protein